MLTKRDIFKTLSCFPLFYLLYFFIAIIWAHPHGRVKEPVIGIFLIGLTASITLVLPVWLYLGGSLFFEKEKRNNTLLLYGLFLIPAFLLFYFLILHDVFCFWGCIVD